MSYSRQLQELEDQGIDLIEVLGQDRHIDSPEALEKIISQLGRNGDSIYSELLHYLTRRHFNPEQAKRLWAAIMKNKARMTELLGRKVAFRVAALDYLSNRSGILRQVRLIARPEFESILSHVNTDEVTGIYNRRYFNEILSQEVRRARRYSNELSLLLLDVDDFKRVNDAFGHVEGDAVLRRLGRLLRDNTRQTDSVCRFGGDEFAIVLPQTSNAEAGTLAERIRKAQPMSVKAGSPDSVFSIPRTFSVRSGTPEGVRDTDSDSPKDVGRAGEARDVLTVSIGVATYPGDCEEAEELIAFADQMCLEAKRQGKNQIRLSGEHGLGPARAAE